MVAATLSLLVHPRIPLNGCLDIKPLSLSILWKGGRSTAAQTTHVRAKALEAVREGEQDRWFGRERISRQPWQLEGGDEQAIARARVVLGDNDVFGDSAINCL